MTHQAISISNALHLTDNTIQVHALLEGQFKKISAITLKAGHELKKHDAPSDTLLVLMEGRAVLEFRDVTVELKPKDALVLLPGNPHSLRCKEDCTLLLLR